MNMYFIDEEAEIVRDSAAAASYPAAAVANSLVAEAGTVAMIVAPVVAGH